MDRIKVASNILGSPNNTGPGNFGRLLSDNLKKLGIDIYPARSVIDGADAFLGSAFIEETLIHHCKRNDIPIILRVDGVGEIFPYDNYNNDFLRVKYSHSNADMVIYQSSFSERYVQSKTNFVPLNSHTILNGIEYEPKVNLNTKPMNYISICNNWNKFRYMNFYHAIYSNLGFIVNEFPDFKWTIVGKYKDFKMSTQLCSMVHPDTAKRCIEWIEFTPDLDKIRREASAVIHIVGKDSCPNSLIESMSYGLPAIVWHDSGGPEIAGKAGAVINNCSTDEVLSAIRKIEENRDMMSQIAVNRISHNCNILNVAQQYAIAIKESIDDY